MDILDYINSLSSSGSSKSNGGKFTPTFNMIDSEHEVQYKPTKPKPKKEKEDKKMSPSKRRAEILDFKNFKSVTESTKNDTKFIPTFQLFEKDNNDKNIVPGWEVNKPLKYDKSKMIKAIQNGMIILIKYKGEDDGWNGGRERTIYPMVLGVNKNTGNELLRAWHLEGYSLSAKKDLEKVWRLFKTSNIKSMTFTGDFYRLIPKGYKMNDRTMTERVIQRARYNDVVRNQRRLLLSGKIEDDNKTNIKEDVVPKMVVQNLERTVDLTDPWSTQILADKKKRADKVKVTILKSVLGNNWMYVLNVNGHKGNGVVVFDGDKKLGTFKVVESFKLSDWKNYRNVKGQREMPLYLFKEEKK